MAYWRPRLVRHHGYTAATQVQKTTILLTHAGTWRDIAGGRSDSWTAAEDTDGTAVYGRMLVKPWLYFLFGVLCLLVSARASIANANTEEALALITDTAQKICNDVPTAGERQSVEVNGNVKAELAGLLKKLGNVGVSGTGGYSSDEYAGLLQKDLAAALKDNSDCKLTVLKLLLDRVLPQTEATTRQAQAQDQAESLRRRLSAITPKFPVYIKCRTMANACEKLAYFFFDVLQKAGWQVAPPMTTQGDNVVITGEHGITIISSSFSAEELANALRSPDAGAYPAMLDPRGAADRILINIVDLP